MSLFGKILVVLNILGAAGLAALASMDYARRQTWSYAVFRNELMLDGLPLDEAEHQLGGEPLARKLSAETLKDVCVGGPAVDSQEKEVERVQQDLQARLKQQAGTSKRHEVYLLAQVLLPQSLTNAQREDYLASRYYLASDEALAGLQKEFKVAYNKAAQDKPDRFDQVFHQAVHEQLVEPSRPFTEAFLELHKAAPQTAFDKLFADTLEQLRRNYQTRLDDAFREARGERLVGKTTQKSTAEERRTVIARLLFLLVDILPDPKAPSNPDASKRDLVDNIGYRRYLNVVGLRRAVRQINDQAEILRRIASELDAAIQHAALDEELARDRIRFVLEHRALLAEVRARAEDVRSLSNYLEIKKKERDTQLKDVVKPRQLDVQKYEAELKDSRDQTAAQLAVLRRLSQALFDKRVEVRDALQQNFLYERKIRELEANR